MDNGLKKNSHVPGVLLHTELCNTQLPSEWMNKSQSEEAQFVMTSSTATEPCAELVTINDFGGNLTIDKGFLRSEFTKDL